MDEDDVELQNGKMYFLAHHGMYKQLSEVMMGRAPYDTTYDAYYGLTSTVGAPGTKYRTELPCRVVPQREIAQEDFPFNQSASWMTYEGPQLNTALATHVSVGVYSYDFNSADLVAVPSGVEPQYIAVREEFIQPAPRGSYFRILLCPRGAIPSPPPPPPPPPPPTPGTTCATAYTVSFDTTYVDTAPGVGATARYWRFPVVGGTAYYMLSDWETLGGGSPTFGNGVDCNWFGDVSIEFTPEGQWQLAGSETGWIWLEFRNRTGSDIGYSFRVQTHL